MSTNRSVGRSTATQEKDRFASKSKKDRSTNLCAFTFADGRQCRTPRCSGHLHLCYFHAQKEAASLAAQHVGEDISRFLPVKLLTACDLGVAMSRLFCAVAQGQVKPKVAGTLAYLAQTMLQSIPIAQDEYIHSFDTNAWRREIRSSFNVPAPQPGPPRPASQPAPKPPASSASAPTAKPVSSPAPQPSAQPAPSPHTPLPPTSTEFAQQLLAGRNSSRSEISSQSQPGREPASSDSSSSPAPSSASPVAPQPPVNCHSERSEEPAAASHHSNPSQLKTRSTTRYLHQRRPFPRLCHPALAPPPTGTS